jgi:hypothetical protein
LGPVSDFVCEQIGSFNDEIREGELAADALWDAVEEAVDSTPRELFEAALRTDETEIRRVALLDLVWIERSLNIAFGASEDYKRARDKSYLFQLTKAIAEVENRNPMLSWSEIAIYHPTHDPRSFLVAGEDRDQEILMYRIQGGMERSFKSILQSVDRGEYRANPIDWMSDVVSELDAVVRAMIHLSRVRRIGQFYKLDPFLGVNNEYIGHGTGAFSVWTFLIAELLSGSPHVAARISNPDNYKAFDRDADDYVARVSNGTFETLDVLFSKEASLAANVELQELRAQAQKKLTQFLQTHRGAMKKHSPASFDDEAPSAPPLSNEQAIDVAITESSPRR